MKRCQIGTIVANSPDGSERRCREIAEFQLQSDDELPLQCPVVCSQHLAEAVSLSQDPTRVWYCEGGFS